MATALIILRNFTCIYWSVGSFEQSDFFTKAKGVFNVLHYFSAKHRACIYSKAIVYVFECINFTILYVVNDNHFAVHSSSTCLQHMYFSCSASVIHFKLESFLRTNSFAEDRDAFS